MLPGSKVVGAKLFDPHPTLPYMVREIKERSEIAGFHFQVSEFVYRLRISSKSP